VKEMKTLDRVNDLARLNDELMKVNMGLQNQIHSHFEESKVQEIRLIKYMNEVSDLKAKNAQLEKFIIETSTIIKNG
jgi:hypothetical protein